eukprot:GHVQ01017571.1.p1 GENE.GHVQ01017571.1~~GHVQ01017571.1.p1  ORF type:complete len:1492 (+),score=237.35 GHVQ01017571.1:64-4539(+)
MGVFGFVCCGLLVLFFVVFLPILFAVVIPGVVRSAVRDSQFTLDKVTLTNPQLNQVDLSVETTLIRNTGISGTMTELPLSLHWQERRLGRMVLPEMTMKGKVTKTAFTNTLFVEDLDVWDEFLTELMAEGKAEWRLEGLVTVQAIGMTFTDIPFEKVLAVQGPPLKSTDGEAPFRIIDFDMSGSTSALVKLRLEVEFVNLGKNNIVPVGDMGFAMKYKGLYLGPLRAPAISMYEGVNVFHMEGEIAPWEKLDGLPEMEQILERERIQGIMGELVSAAVSGWRPMVTAVGMSCSTPLYEAAIKALRLDSRMNGLGGSKSGEKEVVDDLQFKGFELQEVPGDPNRVHIKSTVVAHIFNPLGSQAPLIIDEVNFSGRLHEGSQQGAFIGSMESKLTALGESEVLPLGYHLESISSVRRLQNLQHSEENLLEPIVSLPSSELSTVAGVSERSVEMASPLDYGVLMRVVFSMDGYLLLEDGGEAFGMLVRRLIQEPEVKLVFADTTSNVKTRSALGDLLLTGVRLDKPLKLKGFGGMSDVKLQRYEFTGVNSEGAWELEADVLIPNETPTTVPLGDIALELLHGGIHMGVMTSPAVTIRQGDNLFKFKGLLNPSEEDVAAVSDFFASYVSGRETTLDVRFTDSPTSSFNPSSTDDTSPSSPMEESRNPLEQQEPVRAPRWISESLKSLSLSFPMPRLGDDRRGGEGSIVRSTNMESLQLIPMGMSQMKVEGRVKVVASNPLGNAIPLSVHNIGIAVALKTAEGTVIGRLNAPPVAPVSQVTVGDRMDLYMDLEGSIQIEGDGSNFAEYFKQVQSLNVVPLQMVGAAELRLKTSLGLLNLGEVELDSEMEMKGFGGELSSAHVENMHFTGRDHTLGAGVGFTVDLSLNVPSMLSIYLGTVVFDLLYGSAPLGRIFITDMDVRQGLNTYKVKGVLSPTTEDLPIVSELFSNYIAGSSELSLQVQGSSATLDSGARPPWLQKSVKTISQEFPMPPMPDIVKNSFSDIQMSDLALNALSPKLSQRGDSVALSAAVTAQIRSPFGDTSPITVTKASVALILSRKMPPQSGNRETDGIARTLRRLRRESKGRRLQRVGGQRGEGGGTQKLGNLSVVGLPVRQTGMEIQMELVDAVLEFVDRGEKFSDMALEIIRTTDTQNLVMRGKANVVVDTDMGSLSLVNIPLETNFAFTGLAVFDTKDGKPSMFTESLKELRVSEFDDNLEYKALKIGTNLNMDNMSKVAVSLGTLLMDIQYKGVRMGTVGLKDFSMARGKNKVALLGAVKPADKKLFGEFVSLFISNKPLVLHVNAIPDIERVAQIAESSTNSEAITARMMQVPVTARNPFWLRKLLEGIQLEVPLNDVEDMGRMQSTTFVEGAKLEGLDVDLSTAGNPTISGAVRASYKLPEAFSIQHEIMTVDSTLSMELLEHDEASESGSLLGLMELRQLSPVEGSDLGSVVFNIKDVDLQVPKASAGTLSKFFHDVMHTTGESVISVSGSGGCG